MNRRRIALTLPVALAALSTLAACSRSDPERELRETIARMATAIETREPARLLDHLAEDFTRESGGFDKQDAKRLLAGVLLRNERIDIANVVTDVEVTGNQAKARVRVIAAGSASGLLPERGQTWDFTTAWRRDGSKWVVFNAQWREGI
jgi:hypothetical protein